MARGWNYYNGSGTVDVAQFYGVMKGVRFSAENTTTGDGLFINQTGEGRAIDIVSTAVGIECVHLATVNTSNNVIELTNTATGSATGLMISMSSASTGANVVLDANGVSTTAYALNIDRDANDASTTYAVKIDSDNAGAGNGGGIDFASMGVDEPLFKVVADAITNPGTLSGQIAIEVGSTLVYIPYYTHGS